MQSKDSNICAGRGDIGCGGQIFPLKMDGRWFLFKDVVIFLDKDLEIPRCDKCKADWIDDDTQIALDVILNRDYEQHRELIESARQRFRDRQ